MNRFGQNSVEQESSQAQQETLEIFTDSDPDLKSLPVDDFIRGQVRVQDR